MSSNYRRIGLEEHGDVCSWCGSGSGVEIHHRDGDRTNNDVDNLLPLCHDCHVQLHQEGLGGYEAELLPRSDRPHIDHGQTTFQFQIDDDKWEAWKNTVPRSKSLETRIIELIEADTDA